MDAVTDLYTSDSLSARVAAEVRSQAAKRGLKQVDIARLLGMSQPQVSLRLRGKVPFRLEEIDVLARHFGVDAAELMPPRPQVADGADRLPRLDLNQQPFGWMSAQLGGGSVVPLFAPGDPRWTTEPNHATRPDQGHPFRPILVTARHLVAI
jgi:transcriptional regulator with XRE-family HTH domain